MAFVYFRYSLKSDFLESGETMQNGSKAQTRCQGWVTNRKGGPIQTAETRSYRK